MVRTAHPTPAKALNLLALTPTPEVLFALICVYLRKDKLFCKRQEVIAASLK